MAELSKQALKVENQTNFPNNNTGYITPDLLRGFNTDMIDSNVNQSAYNTDSSSWNSSIANINAFTSSAQSLTTSSLLITASAAGNTITFTKGNGVNSRALNAMRVIGAAVFPDQPRNDQEIKENLYEYLNLPEFNMPVPSHYYAFIQDIEDFEEKGSYIFMGMVKSIKRGQGWSRVEILDKTGSVGIFDDEQTTIETGASYLILVNDNRIVSAVPMDQIKESKSGLVKFLNYRMLPYKEDEMFVVSFKPRVTKAGKKMASLNKINERVFFDNFCFQETLLADDLKNALIISDCEGYELDLFCNEKIINHLFKIINFITYNKSFIVSE